MKEPPSTGGGAAIPGLDEDDVRSLAGDVHRKKVPYAKPVPRMFEAAWESGVQPDVKPGVRPPQPRHPPGL